MRQLLAFLLFLTLVTWSKAGIISGSVFFDEPYTNPYKQIVVNVYKLSLDRYGKPIPVSLDDLYNPYQTTPAIRLQLSPHQSSFSVSVDEGGVYSLFAFVDFEGEMFPRLERAPPLGWYAEEEAGWIAPIDMRHSSIFNSANIVLKRAHPFTPEQFNRTIPPHVKGRLTQMKGFTVMQLWGTPTEIAYAHGYLAPAQIIDWFRFYVLERVIRSSSTYLQKSVPFLVSKFANDPNMLEEQNAMLAGMRDSGANLYVPELKRNFSTVEILAIEAYIELGRCSQFAAWGSQTVDGNTIVARNMDGELDPRKVTVTHLTIFAVNPAPTEREKPKRYVSVMWPGFLGTLSSINEDGIHAMMNTGMTALNDTTGFTPVSWILRQVVTRVDVKTATPSNILNIINRYKSVDGGPSWSGVVFFFAKPHISGYLPTEPPAFVYEGDRFGGAMRLPGQFAPWSPHCVMATNHFLQYGADPYNPDIVFGQQISFSSKTRYWSGNSFLQSRYRSNLPLKSADAENWLQRVSSGYTEHSIYFTPHDRIIRIANAQSTATMWDSPYEEFTEFDFESLF